MTSLVNAFKDGWSQEAHWKGDLSNPPREALYAALAGKIIEEVERLHSNFPSQQNTTFDHTPGENNYNYDSVPTHDLHDVSLDNEHKDSPLMKEEISKVDWRTVSSELGRGARRSVRSVELYPLHALCWASILVGALRLNKNAFACVGATVSVTVWCAHPNPITLKLHDDAQLAASKIEEAVGIGRKHLHKTLSPLTVFAICIWFIPKSLEGPATMIYGGGLGAIFGHIVGAPNEWTPPPLSRTETSME